MGMQVLARGFVADIIKAKSCRWIDTRTCCPQLRQRAETDPPQADTSTGASAVTGF